MDACAHPRHSQAMPACERAIPKQCHGVLACRCAIASQYSAMYSAIPIQDNLVPACDFIAGAYSHDQNGETEHAVALDMDEQVVYYKQFIRMNLFATPILIFQKKKIAVPLYKTSLLSVTRGYHSSQQTPTYLPT